MVGLADNWELGHHDEYGRAGQYQQAVGTSSFLGMGYMEGGGLISAGRTSAGCRQVTGKFEFGLWMSFGTSYLWRLLFSESCKLSKKCNKCYHPIRHHDVTELADSFLSRSEKQSLPSLGKNVRSQQMLPPS